MSWVSDSLFGPDSFCKKYNQWEKSDAYKNDSDKKILNTIKDNLKVLSEIDYGQRITDFEFNDRGEIRKIEGGRSGDVSIKERDLTKFVEFVQRYFKDKVFLETEAKELRTVLQAANYKTDRQLHFSLSNIDDVFAMEDYPVSSRPNHPLLLAAEDILINEKLEINNVKSPGKDLIINKFNENREILKESIKKFDKLKIAQRIEKAGIVGSIIGLVGALPLIFFFPPIGLALFGTFLLTFIGSTAALNFSHNAQNEAKIEINHAKDEIRMLEDMKKHYDEPEFLEFLNKLPEDKRSLESDPEKFQDLHRLYDTAKELKQNGESHSVETDYTKKLDLIEKSKGLKDLVLNLQKKLGLSEV
jgi:hypothetical protein